MQPGEIIFHNAEQNKRQTKHFGDHHWGKPVYSLSSHLVVFHLFKQVLTLK